MALICLVNPNGFVVASWDELSASGSEIHRDDGRSVIHVNVQGPFQIPYVKCIQIVVFVGTHEHKSLHRIPSYAISL